MKQIFKVLTSLILLAYFFYMCLSLPSQLERYILLSIALFCIGIYGLLTQRNAIRVLMSIEIILNAVNINLVAFSTHIDPLEIKGQVFSIFVMAIAACEAAVALAIILAIYRNKSSVDMEDFSLLKW